MDENLKWISSREYWNVNTSGDISQIKLEWTENQHNIGETCIHDICPNGNVNLFSFDDLTVVAYHNNKWRDLGVSSHSGNHDNGSITSNLGLPTGAKSGTYIVSLGSLNIDVTLPVELINFSANSIDNNVELFWETASEVNNEGFIIEHATSNYLFNEIGFVAGNGNSSFTNSYNLLHDNPAKGINYYRLKQIDFDGNYEYSNVIAVSFSESLNNESISYFIDENQTLHIDTYLKESNYLNLHIYDSHGRLVYEESKANQDEYFKYRISLNYLKAGMYYFILSNEESLISNKFIMTE
ncbi:MAG: T9SS type A sorting domain-containing protein [Bacteroidales bacterium]|nr:T9SS type A sorting domain-containing protein [Bacteroidales bacterium]